MCVYFWHNYICIGSVKKSVHITGKSGYKIWWKMTVLVGNTGCMQQKFHFFKNYTLNWKYNCWSCNNHKCVIPFNLRMIHSENSRSLNCAAKKSLADIKIVSFYKSEYTPCSKFLWNFLIYINELCEMPVNYKNRVMPQISLSEKLSR